MDDRSFIGEQWSDVDSRISAWADWSDSVNLRENAQKTQVTARGPEADIELCPEPWRKEEVKMLGCHSVSRGARACLPGEVDSVRKARRRADLLGKVGLPFDILTRACHCVVTSLAAYGWVGRRPTWEHANHVFDGIAKAHSACRLANNKIRKVLSGARCHLDLVVVMRLFKRKRAMLALCRGPTTPLARPDSCADGLRSTVGAREVPGNGSIWTCKVRATGERLAGFIWPILASTSMRLHTLFGMLGAGRDLLSGSMAPGMRLTRASVALWPSGHFEKFS